MMLPKKLLRNYILFDITHTLEDSTESDNSLSLPSEEEKQELGCVVMVGTDVTTVKVGDEVFIPNTPNINPLILKIKEKTYLMFRESDVAAIL